MYWVRVIVKSLLRGRFFEVNCVEVLYGDIVGLLWKLVESINVVIGVWWWVVGGLVCFNIYGFLSFLGRDICKILDEFMFFDIIFFFKDGRCLFVYGVILII